MFRHIARQAARSQRWQSASKQEEPLLDQVMRGDPEACSILGGILVAGLFALVYKLMK